MVSYEAEHWADDRLEQRESDRVSSTPEVHQLWSPDPAPSEPALRRISPKSFVPRPQRSPTRSRRVGEPETGPALPFGGAPTVSAEEQQVVLAAAVCMGVTTASVPWAGAPMLGNQTPAIEAPAVHTKPRAPINARKLGGTDMAALMGLSDYGGPIDVYARVIGGVERTRTPQMRRGQLFERGIGQLWIEEHHPDWALTWRTPTEHPTRTWQRFSLDFDVLGPDVPSIGDSKRCRDAGDRHGPPGTDQVAHQELVQLTTYMEALRSVGEQVERAYLVVHDQRSDEILEWVVPYNEELGAMIVEAGERFWREHVGPQVVPPITGSELARRYLESRHPRAKVPMRDASPEELDLALRLRVLQMQRSDADDEIERIRNTLMGHIGDARGIRGAWGSITWTVGEPAIVREHTREGGRVLRTHWTRERKRA